MTFYITDSVCSCFVSYHAWYSKVCHYRTGYFVTLLSNISKIIKRLRMLSLNILSVICRAILFTVSQNYHGHHVSDKILYYDYGIVVMTGQRLRSMDLQSSNKTDSLVCVVILWKGTLFYPYSCYLELFVLCTESRISQGFIIGVYTYLLWLSTKSVF